MGDFLRKKYRLVVLNDSTFGEKISLRLTPWGIIIGVLAVTIVMTTIVISTVAFTPLREYIPGYGNIAERKQLLKLSLKTDSIEQTLETRDLYLKSLLNVVNERVETKTTKPKKDTTGKYKLQNIKPSGADIQFREEYEENKNNVAAGVAKLKYKGLSELVFFAPVKGLITTSYNIPDDHFGVDVVTKQDETIKSTLDGTVIFAGFSAQDGNVIQIQHSNNLVSIYKHCSTLLKKTGARVKSGEAIAVVGNTGEKSHGSHLHFELWFNGSPINPQEFVSF
jgi:septal ring factor EnvC (AmiA/AmiB activator)